MKAAGIYHIDVQEADREKILARVRFDPDHAVYKGHFPGFPVTPGVCQLSLVKEVLEEKLREKLLLKTARNIKFLRMHDPATEAVLMLELRLQPAGKEIMVNAVLSGTADVYFKCRCSFVRS